MHHLELIDTGILTIRPDPSRWHQWSAFTLPVALAENEFIATFQRGAAMYAADSHVMLTRSHDGGRTWEEQGVLIDGRNSTPPCSYHDAQMSRMSDGTLVAVAFRIDRTEPDRPMFDAGGGLLPIESVIVVATDDGATWSDSRQIPIPDGLNLTIASPIVELTNGRWLAVFDRFKSYGEEGRRSLRYRVVHLCQCHALPLGENTSVSVT